MHNKAESRHMIDILFVLTLFCVFAISALTLVTLGANIYQRTVDHMESNFESRTPYSYITQKIRQADQTDGISVGSVDELEAILINQKMGDTLYTTYLYEYEGYLCELFVRADQSLSANAGNRIIEVKSFEITELESNLFSLELTTIGGENLCMQISTRCGNED